MISNFELEMVGESDGVCEVLIGATTEQKFRYEKLFWTVYQRYDPDRAPDQFRGADALADCDTRDEASNLMEHWERVLSTLKPIYDVSLKLQQS